MQMIEDRITDQLIDYHKENGHSYIGDILLKPEDYQTLLGECINVQVRRDGKYFCNHKIVSISDKDLGWWAIELSGLPKDNPEVLELLRETEFRKGLYND